MKYTTGIPRQDRGFDLRNLPDTQTIRSRKSAGIFMVIFGLFLTGFIILITVGIAREVKEGWYVLVFALFGIALVVSGLRHLLCSTQVSLSRNSVNVEERTLLGGKQWQEPIRQYQGVLYDIEYHSTGSGNSRSHCKVYTIKLLHTDQKKMITLFETLNENGFRQRWEDAASFFQLPAFEKQDGELVERQVADLDKNLSELVSEDKLVIDQGLLTTTPTGLALEKNGDETVITYKMQFKPIPFIVFSAIPVALIYAGFFVKKAPVILVYVGGFFAFVILALITISLITTIRLVMTKQEVILENIVFGATMLHESIQLKMVEQIRVGRLDSESGNGVILASDEKKLQVGTGLSEASIKWLEAFILKMASDD